MKDHTPPRHVSPPIKRSGLDAPLLPSPMPKKKGRGAISPASRSTPAKAAAKKPSINHHTRKHTPAVDLAHFEPPRDKVGPQHQQGIARVTYENPGKDPRFFGRKDSGHSRFGGFTRASPDRLKIEGAQPHEKGFKAVLPHTIDDDATYRVALTKTVIVGTHALKPHQDVRVLGHVLKGIKDAVARAVVV